MSEEGSKSADLLGLKPYGEAVKVATEGVVRGAEAFLSRLCNPVAEELGLLFRDRISHWRAVQAAKLAEKAEQKLKAIPNSDELRAPPRLVGKIIENGSWVDAENVQDMWAGLLASSCSKDGDDESNLMFIGLLSQLTASQAKILHYGCENAQKRPFSSGLVTASHELQIDFPRLIEIAGVNDVNRLDRELDHLRALGLMEAGIDENNVNPELMFPASVTPTDLGLQMYVRCQGSRQTPAEYFGLE